VGDLQNGAGAHGLYMPCFLWAWLYYGSPVPNTVSAKSPLLLVSAGCLKFTPLSILTTFVGRVGQAFGPYAMNSGGWPVWTRPLAGVVGAVSVLYCLVPTRDSFGRKASLTFVLLSLYLSFPYPYAWYFPPVGMCGMVDLGRGARGLARMAARRHARAAHVVYAVTLTLAVGFSYLLVLSAEQMRITQGVSSDRES